MIFYTPEQIGEALEVKQPSKPSLDTIKFMDAIEVMRSREIKESESSQVQGPNTSLQEAFQVLGAGSLELDHTPPKETGPQVIPNAGNDYEMEDLMEDLMMTSDEVDPREPVDYKEPRNEYIPPKYDGAHKREDGWYNSKGERINPPPKQFFKQARLITRNWDLGEIFGDIFGGEGARDPFGGLKEQYLDPIWDEENEEFLRDPESGEMIYTRKTNRRQERIVGTMQGGVVEMLMGPRIFDIYGTINNIMHGSPQVAQESFFGILEDILMWIPELVGGALSKAMKFDERAVRASLGPGAGDKRVQASLKQNVLTRESAAKLRDYYKKGMIPPRKILKIMDGILPEPIKPYVIKQNIWENFVMPLDETIQGVTRGLRFIPSPAEGMRWKSISEVFIPAIERADEKGMADIIREATAKKQLTTGAQNEFAQKMLKVPGTTRLKMLDGAMSGKFTGDLEADKALRQLWVSTNQAGMSQDMEKIFNKKIYKKLEGLKSPWLDDPFIKKETFKVLKEVEDMLGNKFSARKFQKKLAKEIKNSKLPDEIQYILYDIHDLPFLTATELAQGSRKAADQWMIKGLKARPDIVTADEKVAKNAGMVFSDFPGLKGLWVDRDVELELRALKDISKVSNRLYNKMFMAPWKTAKIILRPATHFRNVMSNAILNDWGGLPWYRMDYYRRAYKGLPKMGFRGDAGWRDYARATGGLGTFSSSEVEIAWDHLRHNATLLDAGLSLFHDNRITKGMRNLYNAEEQLFKYAKFLWNRDKGMNITDAALDAMKWTFNYGEITKFTSGVRSYLSPFFTWQSKVLPLMFETAYKHPVKFWKWPAMLWGMQNLAYKNLDLKEHEWNWIEQQLPDYIQDSQFMLMPWRDEKGRLQLLNLTYILPGLGDVSEMFLDPAGYGLGSPLLSLSAALLSKRRFSGAPLYTEWDSTKAKAMKTINYIWEQLVPSLPIMPWTIQAEKMMDIINDHPESMTWNQMIAGEMGLKLTPLNMEKLARTRHGIDRIHRSEMVSRLEKDLRHETDIWERRRILTEFNENMTRHLQPESVPLTRKHIF